LVIEGFHSPRLKTFFIVYFIDSFFSLSIDELATLGLLARKNLQLIFTAVGAC